LYNLFKDIHIYIVCSTIKKSLTRSDVLRQTMLPLSTEGNIELYSTVQWLIKSQLDHSR